MRKLAVICAAFILYGCTSTEPANIVPGSFGIANNFFITLPNSGGLAIIGVSGPQQKRETEVEIAREDAAKKAAMYHGVKVRYDAMQSIGSGIFDYHTDSNLTLEYDQQLEPYLDKLSFNPDRDVMVRDGTVFIRFAYPAVFPGSIRYTFGKNPDGSPEWTINRPQRINGFIAGVGFSSRQFMRQDAFVKSRESAAADLVSLLSTHVSTSNTLAGSQNTSVINIQSTGNLDHFLVLEIWVDPDTQAVWTLAVARNTE